MSKKKEHSVFDQIVEGLEASIAYSKGERSLPTATLPSAPPEPKPKQIASLRKRHNMTQSAFAATLNVSTKTVQAWEQGVRRPSHASARLLQVIDRSPDVVSLILSEPPKPKRRTRSIRAQ